jgi:cyclopropane-fatty-acyl-phospholipid synthase
MITIKRQQIRTTPLAARLTPRSETWLESLSRRVMTDLFKKMEKGCLKVYLPGNGSFTAGTPGTLPSATIEVNDPKFFTRCLFAGAIGFGESYVAGEWMTNDLTAVIYWFLANGENSTVLDGSTKKPWAFNLAKHYNRLIHQRRKNTIENSKKNIGEHYDLSNKLFATFLDRSMTYSSAIFSHANQTLEDAQIAKFDLLCRKLMLNHNDHLLEIGTGWGAFAIYAARNYGCRVTTTTISESQFEYVKEKIEKEGLSERIELKFCDYRKLEGQFDKIASIEMIEAIGDRYVETFCAQCAKLLKRDGLLGLQMIITPDVRYAQLRDGVDFIQKHIFPGSLLMSIERVNRALRATSDLNLHDLKDFGFSYAKTLRLWREKFNAATTEVRLLGFDQAFVRKWNYYLAYCEAAFSAREISVVQAVYSRPNNEALNLLS